METIKKNSIVKVDYLTMGMSTGGSIFADVTKTNKSGFYFKASAKSPSRFVAFRSIGVENKNGITVNVSVL